MMKLIATTDLIGDLVRLYPNCQKSRTKFEEVREEQVWGTEVRRGLRNGTLPFRIGNGSEIRLPDSNEGQTAFAKHIDAEFINGYVDAHDVFEWLKGFRNDADAFAAEYGVDDATLPVASKQTAPQAAPAQQAGTEAAPAGAAVEAAVDGTPSLTTPKIAAAFDGINGLSARQLRAKMGDVKNHQWLVHARHTQGVAPKPSTWWPLLVAHLLEDRGATFESLNRKFLNEKALKPWLRKWQEARHEQNAFGE